jgi:hypothetical protein
MGFVVVILFEMRNEGKGMNTAFRALLFVMKSCFEARSLAGYLQGSTKQLRDLAVPCKQNPVVGPSLEKRFTASVVVPMLSFT